MKMRLLMRLHVGTSNPGKLREYREILAPLGYEVVTVVAPEPDEPEPDLEGNARIKAAAYGYHAGGLTIAEDSGLVVPALHGLPGVVSARFSDCELDLATGRVLAIRPSHRPRPELDAANRARLLSLMDGLDDPHRRAFFRAVIAVADGSGTVLFTATGEAHGRILREERGTGGFGYDSLFAGDDTPGLTFAEAPADQKNAVSHRRRAVDQVRDWLATHARIA